MLEYKGYVGSIEYNVVNNKITLSFIFGLFFIWAG